jgi:hypothetical protein
MDKYRRVGINPHPAVGKPYRKSLNFKPLPTSPKERSLLTEQK